MDQAATLRNSSHWRLAVWGLRVMGPGLAVVVAGLVTLLWSTAAGQAILAVGMGIYLVGVVITVVGIVLVYREVPPPRPNFIWLRWSLMHDAVHARSASAEQVAEGTGPLGERPAEPTHMEALRHSAHWRRAVWGARVMGPALLSSSRASSPSCGRRLPGLRSWPSASASTSSASRSASSKSTVPTATCSHRDPTTHGSARPSCTTHCTPGRRFVGRGTLRSGRQKGPDLDRQLPRTQPPSGRLADCALLR